MGDFLSLTTKALVLSVLHETVQREGVAFGC